VTDVVCRKFEDLFWVIRQVVALIRFRFPRIVMRIDRITDHTHMRLVIYDFGHEAGTDVSDTDSELVLAPGASHRLFDIALRVGLPIRQDVIAGNFLNGLADRLPTSRAYKH
jgi:hypothetical protein